MVAVPLVCEYAAKVLVQNALALGDNVSTNVCIARLRGNPHFRFEPLFKGDGRGLCPFCALALPFLCLDVLISQYAAAARQHASLSLLCLDLRNACVSVASARRITNGTLLGMLRRKEAFSVQQGAPGRV